MSRKAAGPSGRSKAGSAVETVRDFYELKLHSVPEGLREELGHFNVFRLDDFVGARAKPVPYNRRDYFKIALSTGPSRYRFADSVVEVREPALFFANPATPYTWEPLSDRITGYFCIFTEAFFNQFGDIKAYPVFDPGNSPVYLLTAAENKDLAALFRRMEAEIGSDYRYKYDLLRTLVFDLIHRAIRLRPAVATVDRGSNAHERITSVFSELLERQFPVASLQQQVQLQRPGDYAQRMNLHVNHLNRAVRSATGKTTSALIAERLVREACVLLRRTDWNVAEIGYCLGFEAPSYFVRFFKKNTGQTPGFFRA